MTADHNRFARDLVQATGHRMLRDAADSPSAFVNDASTTIVPGQAE
jgi:hypothetical protein